MKYPEPRLLIAAALEYASAGWPVFPLAPRQKQPLYANPHPAGSPERASCRGECGAFGHGVHDATVDPEAITRWWNRTPIANIGLATGAPGPDVVDVDTKHGAPGIATLRLLEGTALLDGCGARVTTPSGGVHLYFLGAMVAQGNGRLTRHGVDFRGTGGYVVAPPSVVDGRAYEWQPMPGGWDWRRWGEVSWQRIRAHLLPPLPPLPPRKHRHAAPESAEALLRWLEGQQEGNRNSALHWAACRLAEKEGTEADFRSLAAVGIRAGLAIGEVAATIASTRRVRVPAE